MRRAAGLFAVIMLALLADPARAQDKPEQLVTGISSEKIEITSNFTGADIVIFGTIENNRLPLDSTRKYDLAIVLQGPETPAVVRRKERTLGIWINRDARSYSREPSSYMVVSTRPLDKLTDAKTLKLRRIGIDNLSINPREEGTGSAAENQAFRDAFVRLKKTSKLYVESAGTVNFLSRSMFKAAIDIPSNIPVGYHFMTAYLFLDGQFLASQSLSLQIEKTGFERFAYRSAHQQPALYGLIAVVLAVLTGWAAGIIFRKN